jgi:hypothetical protein
MKIFYEQLEIAKNGTLSSNTINWWFSSSEMMRMHDHYFILIIICLEYG